jgi:hypothetical protein
LDNLPKVIVSNNCPPQCPLEEDIEEADREVINEIEYGML